MGAGTGEAVARNYLTTDCIDSMKKELKKALTALEVAELVCVGITIVVFVVTLLARAIYLAWK